MKYLSFDPGLTHTGVAISYEGTLASGLTTISTKDANKRFKSILHIISQHKPDEIIVGQPHKGPIHDLAHDLSQEISHKTNLPVHLVNEDLSSKMAQKALVQSGKKKKIRQKTLHQAAAAAILQNYLDNF